LSAHARCDLICGGLVASHFQLRKTGLFGDRLEGSLVDPHQRLQRRVVKRDVSGVFRDSHRGNLEVVADPGQHRKALFVGGDLFGR
jgi:hypothetical protein